MKMDSQHTAKRKQAKRARGFVLVLVLFVVVLLTTLLLRFNYAARISIHSSDSYCRSQQAQQYAQGGLNLAIEAIRQGPDTETNPLLQDLLNESVTFAIGDGQCEVKLRDESGKLNLNQLLDKNEKPDRTRVDQLLRLIDVINRQYDTSIVGYDLAPALLDWMDSDNQPTILPYIRGENRGAESPYYETLSPPYRCRNRKCDTISEILLIKGMTAQAFQGRQKRSSGPQRRIGLAESLTVYGSGKVNINTAPKPVLQCLSEHLNESLAQIIIDRRMKKPFGSITELQKLPGITGKIFADLQKTATTQSEQLYYQVTARGIADTGETTIKAILYRNENTRAVEVLWVQEN
jgi:general secretion pathway protein K